MTATTTGLTAEDATVLALAATTWPSQAAYHSQIRERLGWTPVKYFHRLNQLLDTSAAAAAEPVAVNRLRRLRDNSLRVRLALEGHR